MLRRRLALYALVVAALLAVVAVAAHGKPLESGGGSSAGLPQAFWDFLFTTVLIVLVACAALALFVFFHLRHRDPRDRPTRSYQYRTARALAILIGLAALLVFIGYHVNLDRLFHPGQGSTTPIPTITSPGVPGAGERPGSKHVQFRWEELAIVLATLLALGLFLQRSRSSERVARRREQAPELLADALDESLDDLRAEPDVRRAIVAAYARMERALAAAGLPRRPAEAPLEYLERALLSLDTSAPAVRRLTDLFEWARFSHHEPEPHMRDEAVDALVAVRDELRASEPVAA